MNSIHHVTLSNALPTEILYDIRDLLQMQEIKELSRVNKQLRQICLPSLFQHVEFRFSKSGFEELSDFTESDVCHYTTSFTYVVPLLLKPEILDFDYYTSHIFTFQTYRYVEEAKEIYDLKYHDGECPPYMVIYDRLRTMCEEQRSIIDSDLDLTVLSSALQKLPKIRELKVDFCQPVEKKDWLEPYLDLDMTMPERSYGHHLQVVSNAIRVASYTGLALHTICLSQLQLPYHHSWQQQYSGSLLKVLGELLEHIKHLRLDRCNFILELSQFGPTLHRIGMKYLAEKHSSVSYGYGQVVSKFDSVQL
ncbi:hypothetical protein PVAR5_6445 [Paecilomyces variotii No. 5]|uniref:F-box domain-containing protein n=1 Tax=Byssochlamys spectabilis (strain No. 5 / NBRC 109023) TaxID=1356009 RepID=V5I3M4_BYSSN|nr:hypothetical protein PVAR5_6445 [Paecilomyces variotii No. 5]